MGLPIAIFFAVLLRVVGVFGVDHTSFPSRWDNQIYAEVDQEVENIIMINLPWTKDHSILKLDDQHCVHVLDANNCKGLGNLG